MRVFWFIFYWRLFLRVNVKRRQYWLDHVGLGPKRWQAITWANDDPVHWGLDMLIMWHIRQINIFEWINLFQKLFRSSLYKHRHIIQYRLLLRPIIFRRSILIFPLCIPFIFINFIALWLLIYNRWHIFNLHSLSRESFVLVTIAVDHCIIDTTPATKSAGSVNVF